jgi:hypothetical protein
MHKYAWRISDANLVIMWSRNLREPRDHVVTQPTIKIEIWSWKSGHNGNLPQGTNTIGMK